MDIGMYQGAAALNSYEEWQNNVAHNLANVSTAGFKGKRVAIEKAALGKIPANTHDTFQRMLIGSSPEAKDKLDFSQSELVKTDKPTDLAIDGKGFFQLEMPDGSKMFTRDGQFLLNSDYILVSSKGYPVMTEGGAPIEIDPDLERFVINRGGEIFQGDTQVGVLGVTTVEDESVLQSIEGGFLLAGDSAIQAALPGEFSIYQGFKEGSNSKSINEMIQMINLSRSYEANVKIIQTYDSRFGQAISSLGTT